jgi:hypothetical protein
MEDGTGDTSGEDAIESIMWSILDKAKNHRRPYESPSGGRGGFAVKGGDTPSA